MNKATFWSPAPAPSPTRPLTRTISTQTLPTVTMSLSAFNSYIEIDELLGKIQSDNKNMKNIGSPPLKRKKLATPEPSTPEPDYTPSSPDYK